MRIPPVLYDVAVVGAGPSGAYAAYLLAKNGHRVLLLDKERFPRDKVCGGGLSAKTIQLLDFDVSTVVQKRIVGAYLTYQNRDTVIKDLHVRAGMTTLRHDFDNLILQRATDAGATFRPNTTFVTATSRSDVVQVRTSSDTFRARYLLGADGVFSQVRKQCFSQKLVTYAPSIKALLVVDRHVMEKYNDRVLFDFGGMSRGYGWIFPKNDHLDVGVFSIFPSRRIKRSLHGFISRYPSLRSHTHIKVLGSSIPLNNTKLRFQERNIWLLGDAAGFAESFLGEGIYFALRSSILAAQALIQCFDGPESDLYTRSVRRELLPDLRYSELNAKLFFSMPRFGFYRMVRNVHVNHYFTELIAGSVNHRECFFKTLLSMPYWLFSRKFPYVEGLEL